MAGDSSNGNQVVDNGHTPLLVSASRLAELLGISPATLHRLRSAGKLGVRPLRVGGSVRWRLATVERYVAESERAGRLLTLDEWDALDDGAV